MQNGLAGFSALASSSQAPLPQEAWQLKPRQASKRKQDDCNLSPPSEGDEFSPDSTTASSLIASKASSSQSAEETLIAKSTMLSPFLNGMSMDRGMDVTPGSRMTDRMGSRGISSVPPVPAVCNFQRRQGKSAGWAPLAPAVPRNRGATLMSDMHASVVSRNRGGSMTGE